MDDGPDYRQQQELEEELWQRAKLAGIDLKKLLAELKEDNARHRETTKATVQAVFAFVAGGQH